jgi:class 3 adenylate cyclase
MRKGLLVLLALLGGLPPTAEAQPARPSYRIGVLNEAFAATHPTIEGLKAGLRELGLAEGRDVSFDIRFTEGDAQATRPAAAALVKAGVDLIVTSQEGPTQAAKDATQTVPIVFTLVGDPVASGLVRNLAEPEANVTGISSLQTELTAKRLEVLKALVPSIRRVWLIHYGGDLTANRVVDRAREAAPRVKVELVARAVLNAQELALALREARSGDALLAPEVATLDIPVAILEASLRSRVPAVFSTTRLGRLKRFFSPQLAELIVAGDAEDPLRSHRREITVVFLDLRGFTAFAETAEPEEVMGVLRDYHAEMGKLILAHEGTLERFAGDGMMIFFNDPVPVPNPAERALRMAVAMRDRVRELLGKWRKRGYDLDFGVGIAQGYATIGAIGFEGRWDYGAIGTVTNLAARLCGEAKPGQILIPQRLLGAVEDLVEVQPAGELTLKGFHRPVTAHNVRRLK